MSIDKALKTEVLTDEDLTDKTSSEEAHQIFSNGKRDKYLPEIKTIIEELIKTYPGRKIKLKNDSSETKFKQCMTYLTNQCSMPGYDNENDIDIYTAAFCKKLQEKLLDDNAKLKRIKDLGHDAEFLLEDLVYFASEAREEAAEAVEHYNMISLRSRSFVGNH